MADVECETPGALAPDIRYLNSSRSSSTSDGVSPAVPRGTAGVGADVSPAQRPLSMGARDQSDGASHGYPDAGSAPRVGSEPRLGPQPTQRRGSSTSSFGADGTTHGAATSAGPQPGESGDANATGTKWGALKLTEQQAEAVNREVPQGHCASGGKCLSARPRWPHSSAGDVWCCLLGHDLAGASSSDEHSPRRTAGAGAGLDKAPRAAEAGSEDTRGTMQHHASRAARSESVKHVLMHGRGQGTPDAEPPGGVSATEQPLAVPKTSRSGAGSPSRNQGRDTMIREHGAGSDAGSMEPSGPSPSSAQAVAAPWAGSKAANGKPSLKRSATQKAAPETNGPRAGSGRGLPAVNSTGAGGAKGGKFPFRVGPRNAPVADEGALGPLAAMVSELEPGARIELPSPHGMGPVEKILGRENSANRKKLSRPLSPFLSPELVEVPKSHDKKHQRSPQRRSGKTPRSEPISKAAQEAQRRRNIEATRKHGSANAALRDGARHVEESTADLEAIGSKGEKPRSPGRQGVKVKPSHKSLKLSLPRSPSASLAASDQPSEAVAVPSAAVTSQAEEGTGDEGDLVERLRMRDAESEQGPSVPHEGADCGGDVTKEGEAASPVMQLSPRDAALSPKEAAVPPKGEAAAPQREAVRPKTAAARTEARREQTEITPYEEDAGVEDHSPIDASAMENLKRSHTHQGHSRSHRHQHSRGGSSGGTTANRQHTHSRSHSGGGGEGHGHSRSHTRSHSGTQKRRSLKLNLAELGYTGGSNDGGAGGAKGRDAEAGDGKRSRRGDGKEGAEGAYSRSKSNPGKKKPMREGEIRLRRATSDDLDRVLVPAARRSTKLQLVMAPATKPKAQNPDGASKTEVRGVKLRGRKSEPLRLPTGNEGRRSLRMSLPLSTPVLNKAGPNGAARADPEGRKGAGWKGGLGSLIRSQSRKREVGLSSISEPLLVSGEVSKAGQDGQVNDDGPGASNGVNDADEGFGPAHVDLTRACTNPHFRPRPLADVPPSPAADAAAGFSVPVLVLEPRTSAILRANKVALLALGLPSEQDAASRTLLSLADGLMQADWDDTVERLYLQPKGNATLRLKLVKSDRPAVLNGKSILLELHLSGSGRKQELVGLFTPAPSAPAPGSELAGARVTSAEELEEMNGLAFGPFGALRIGTIGAHKDAAPRRTSPREGSGSPTQRDAQEVGPGSKAEGPGAKSAEKLKRTRSMGSKKSKGLVESEAEGGGGAQGGDGSVCLEGAADPGTDPAGTDPALPCSSDVMPLAGTRSSEFRRVQAGWDAILYSDDGGTPPPGMASTRLGPATSAGSDEPIGNEEALGRSWPGKGRRAALGEIEEVREGRGEGGARLGGFGGEPGMGEGANAAAAVALPASAAVMAAAAARKTSMSPVGPELRRQKSKGRQHGVSALAPGLAPDDVDRARQDVASWHEAGGATGNETGPGPARVGDSAGPALVRPDTGRRRKEAGKTAEVAGSKAEAPARGDSGGEGCHSRQEDAQHVRAVRAPRSGELKARSFMGAFFGDNRGPHSLRRAKSVSAHERLTLLQDEGAEHQNQRPGGKASRDARGSKAKGGGPPGAAPGSSGAGPKGPLSRSRTEPRAEASHAPKAGTPGAHQKARGRGKHSALQPSKRPVTESPPIIRISDLSKDLADAVETEGFAAAPAANQLLPRAVSVPRKNGPGLGPYATVLGTTAGTPEASLESSQLFRSRTVPSRPDTSGKASGGNVGSPREVEGHSGWVNRLETVRESRTERFKHKVNLPPPHPSTGQALAADLSGAVAQSPASACGTPPAPAGCAMRRPNEMAILRAKSVGEIPLRSAEPSAAFGQVGLQGHLRHQSQPSAPAQHAQVDSMGPQQVPSPHALTQRDLAQLVQGQQEKLPRRSGIPRSRDASRGSSVESLGVLTQSTGCTDEEAQAGPGVVQLDAGSHGTGAWSGPMPALELWESQEKGPELPAWAPQGDILMPSEHHKAELGYADGMPMRQPSSEGLPVMVDADRPAGGDVEEAQYGQAATWGASGLQHEHWGHPVGRGPSDVGPGQERGYLPSPWVRHEAASDSDDADSAVLAQTVDLAQAGMALGPEAAFSRGLQRAPTQNTVTATAGGQRWHFLSD